MKVLACTEYDEATAVCSAEVWVESPGILPPLSVEDGTYISGLIITAVCAAWGFKFLRLFVSPKTG